MALKEDKTCNQELPVTEETSRENEDSGFVSLVDEECPSQEQISLESENTTDDKETPKENRAAAVAAAVSGKVCDAAVVVSGKACAAAVAVSGKACAAAVVVSAKVYAVMKVIYKWISKLGEFLFSAFLVIVRLVVGAVLWLISRTLRVAEWLSRYLKRFFKKVGEVLYAPISRYVKAFQMGKAEIENAKNEGGSFKGLAARARVTGRIIFGKRGIAVTVANWALPVLSCVFLFNIIGYANNQTYALRLTVNGNFIGYVPDETVYIEAEQIIQQRINYTGSRTESIVLETGFEVEIVGYASTLNNYQLADKMLELLMGADNIKDGFGLYVDDVFYGTLESCDAVNATLEKILDVYRTDNINETVSLDKNIIYIPGLYLNDSFVDEDEIIQTFTSYKSVAKYYTIEENDGYGIIAQKVGMTVEELEHLNPGFSDTVLRVGDQVKITADEPFLSVIITRPETYEESIPYETKYVEDSSLYEGNTQEVTTGVNGVRKVTANVSYINGVEVSRSVTSRTVISNPTSEVLAVGTKPRPSTATAPNATIEKGKLLWPVGGYDGGLIWEVTYEHGGYYGHNGVDIGAAEWTPIYAAHNGYVMDVGSSSTAGNYVKIQGDDGYVTIYYHMVEWPSCYSGQRVTAGDVIGYVGHTGRAQGNHLHFEVRLGGIPLYPLDYLPDHAFASWCVHY